MVMGFLFTLSNFMVFSGSRGEIIPGPLVVLLQQAVIPACMVLSIIVVQVRYRIVHYLGSACIIAGIIISLWPELREIRHVGAMYAVLLVLGSSIPLSLAIILMEHTLKLKQLTLHETWVMWTWVNVFEVLAAVPLIVVMLPIQGIPLSHTFTHLHDGFFCLLVGDRAMGSFCPKVGWWYLGFILVLVATKTNMSLILQWDSATLMWIASTAAVPLSAIAFTWPFIMGRNITHLTPYLWAGLAVVVVGLILYRSTKEHKAQHDYSHRDSVDSQQG